MHWILQNKEWIFSGMGVAIISWITALFNKSAKRKKIKQVQKSGNNSINIQVGGDYKHIEKNETSGR